MEGDGDVDVEVAEECGFFEGYTLHRFLIISLMSSVAFFGIITNLVLLLAFVRVLPGSLFAAALALLDALLCTVYVLLFGVDASFVYLRIEALLVIYHSYIVPVFILSRVIQFAMPYTLILGTFERFVWTARMRTRNAVSAFFTVRGRYLSLAVTISVSIILRIPIAFAMEVRTFTNCSDVFRSISAFPTEWAAQSDAYYVFDLHIMSFAQTLLPFVVLLLLNICIVWHLIRVNRQQSHEGEGESPLAANQAHPEELLAKSAKEIAILPLNHDVIIFEFTAETATESLLARNHRCVRKQLHNAVYTMLAIVSSYLVCNGLHLVLTTLERTGSSVLVDELHPNVSSNFYIAFSDTVSICYMFTSAIRILIYAQFNPTVRSQVADFLKGARRKRKYAIVNNEDLRLLSINAPYKR